jgi:hypothetical protein
MTGIIVNASKVASLYSGMANPVDYLPEIKEMSVEIIGTIFPDSKDPKANKKLADTFYKAVVSFLEAAEIIPPQNLK